MWCSANNLHFHNSIVKPQGMYYNQFVVYHIVNLYVAIPYVKYEKGNHVIG